MHSNRPLRLASADMDNLARLADSTVVTGRNQERFSFSAASREILESAAVNGAIESRRNVTRLLKRGARGDQSRIVLHVGSGALSPSRLHGVFKDTGWHECRCDIDESARPDILASIVDMKGFVEDASCDAIWASHV